MVHINCKYYGADGNLVDAYATNDDGVAVLGLLFDVPPVLINPVSTFNHKEYTL